MSKQSIMLHCLAMPLQSITIEFFKMDVEGKERNVIYSNDDDITNRYNAKLMMLRQSMFLLVSQPKRNGTIRLDDFTEEVKRIWLDEPIPALPPLGFKHAEFVWISPQAIQHYGRSYLLGAHQSQGTRPYGLVELLHARRKKQ